MSKQPVGRGLVNGSILLASLAALIALGLIVSRGCGRSGEPPSSAPVEINIATDTVAAVTTDTADSVAVKKPRKQKRPPKTSVRERSPLDEKH